MIDRRTFLVLGSSAGVVPRPAAAQQPPRLPVLGLVVASMSAIELARTGGPAPIQAFMQGLQDHGWIEGRNLVIERRSAEGDPARAPAIMAELVARGVDVIALAGWSWLQEAAKRATRSIPIVAHFPEDPVLAGMVDSIARPGGNVTGVTLITSPDFHNKQLQLLLELAPRIERVAFLGTRRTLEHYRAVLPPAGVSLFPVEADRVEHFEAAFAAIKRERIEAMIVGGGPLAHFHGRQFVEFAAKSGLPAIYAFRESVADGGLMAYGASVVANFRQMAKLADRILKGAKPADLPVEQPTTFELVINAGTAKALGITIPPALLVQANEVIE